MNYSESGSYGVSLSKRNLYVVATYVDKILTVNTVAIGDTITIDFTTH